MTATTTTTTTTTTNFSAKGTTLLVIEKGGKQLNTKLHFRSYASAVNAVVDRLIV
jgi:hypothetical protein